MNVSKPLALSLLVFCAVAAASSLIYQKDGDRCVAMDLGSCRQCLVDYHNGTSTDYYYHCLSHEGQVSTDCWEDTECDDDNGGVDYFYSIPTRYCSAMRQCEIAMSTVMIFDVVVDDLLTVHILDGFQSVMNQTANSVTVYGEVGKLGFTNTGMKHPLRILRVNDGGSYLTSHGECTIGATCTFGPIQVRLTAHVLDNDRDVVVGATTTQSDFIEKTGAFRGREVVSAKMADEVVGLEVGDFALWQTLQQTVLLMDHDLIVLPVDKLGGFQFIEPVFGPFSDKPVYGKFFTFSDIQYSNGQMNATRTLTGSSESVEVQGDCSAEYTPYYKCNFWRFIG